MPYLGDIHTGIPGGAADGTDVRAVETIADRDALKPHLSDREMVIVRDASADPNVDSGGAIYIYNSATDDFTKLSEAESTDIIHSWSLIQGKPTSTPAQIDFAAGAAHNHGRPLPDIDTAVDWMHQHGQPLADIDDAAVKRHQHGQPLANIDDAAIKRHQHGAALPDIDNAAALAHDHPNKAVLDNFDQNADMQLTAPTYLGRALVQATPGSIYITIAPDAASKQVGDWKDVGAAGIISALRECTRYMVDGQERIYIRLRDGDYTGITSPITPPVCSGGITLQALTGALTVPAAGDYTGNAAHDHQLLKDAYKVRLAFDSWAAIWHFGGGQLYTSRILFDGNGYGDANHVGVALRARSSFIQAWKCSVIGATGGYADLAGTVMMQGGPHCIGKDAKVGNGLTGEHNGVVYIYSASDAQAYFGNYSSGVAAGHGSAIALYGRSDKKAIMDYIKYDALVSATGAGVYAVHTSARDCRRFISSSYGGWVQAYRTKANGARGYQVYAAYKSTVYLNNHTFPASSEPSAKRTLYAQGGSVIRNYSPQGGTPVYSPAHNTEGNYGAWNLS